MTDAALVAFLAWAVERLGLRWEGLRNFRRTVRKRLVRRMAELGLGNLDEYRARIEVDASEEAVLEAMCRIPISRLYRDRAVFDLLASEILPARARAAEREGRRAVRIWSAGCASGEEPHTVAIVWHVVIAPQHPNVELELLATDADEGMLARGRRGGYSEGSLRELPPHLRETALRPGRVTPTTRAPEGRSGPAHDDDPQLFYVRDELRAGLTFRREDVRRAMPEGPFDVVLCRNMLLTYIDVRLQPPLLEQLIARLLPGGALVIGSREAMPPGIPRVQLRGPGVYIAADSAGR